MKLSDFKIDHITNQMELSTSEKEVVRAALKELSDQGRLDEDHLHLALRKLREAGLISEGDMRRVEEGVEEARDEAGS